MDKKRVLIVDDEVGLSRLIQMSLERTGRYVVRVVNRAREALPAAQRFTPDVILMDVIMPDAGGGQVASLLNNNPAVRSVPIIFLTAIANKEEVSKGGGLIGGHPFLAKPVELEDLIACIEQHSGGR